MDLIKGDLTVPDEPPPGMHRSGRLIGPRNTDSPETSAFMEVLKRDPCAYCGSLFDVTIDHIQPVARGGYTRLDNLTAACWTCNRLKLDDSLLGFFAWKRWLDARCDAVIEEVAALLTNG